MFTTEAQVHHLRSCSRQEAAVLQMAFISSSYSDLYCEHLGMLCHNIDRRDTVHVLSLLRFIY